MLNPDNRTVCFLDFLVGILMVNYTAFVGGYE